MFQLTSTNSTKKKPDDAYLSLPYYRNEQWLKLYTDKLRSMAREYNNKEKSQSFSQRRTRSKGFGMTSPLNTTNNLAMTMNPEYSNKKGNNAFVFPNIREVSKGKGYVKIHQNNSDVYVPDEESSIQFFRTEIKFSKLINDLQKCKMNTMFPNYRNCEPRFNKTYHESSWKGFSLFDVGKNDDKGIQTSYPKDKNKEMKEKYLNYVSQRSIDNYKKYYY